MQIQKSLHKQKETIGILITNKLKSKPSYKLRWDQFEMQWQYALA